MSHHLLKILTMTAGLYISSVAAGNSKGTTKAALGPDKNDHADYYSGLDLNLSKRDLMQADRLRVSTIESIQKLLKSKIRKEQEFELYLRLGELFAERHDYIRGLEIKSFEEEYDRWIKTKAGKEPTLIHKKSKRELAKSANAFRRLVQNYPNHRRTDAALFALAKTLGRLDDPGAAIYFKQLIKKYKKSPLIPDAHLALGEYYFYKQKIEPALESYKMVLPFKESRAYLYAVYKIGWAYFNLKPKNNEEFQDNISRSLAAFKLVIKLSDSKKGSKSFNLRQEAVNDLVLVWSETGDVDSALSYFKRIGENKAFYDLLERLGNIYDENGENKKAIELYSRLLKEAPLRKSSPAVYSKLLALLERSAQIEQLISYAEEMAARFGKKSEFTIEYMKDSELLSEAKEKTRWNIHRYSTLFHKLGRKSKNVTRYLKGAASLYSLYLSYFPNDKQAYELRYYLAEIHFHFNEFEQASDQYVIVSRAKVENPKYQFDAAKNAVVSIINLAKDEKPVKLPKAGSIENKMTIPGVKLKLVNVIDNFVELLPKHKNGIPMRFTAGKIYFDYGHYDEAIRRFEQLIVELPKTKQAKSSVNIVFGFYTDRKDWDSLIKKSRQYLKDKRLEKVGLSETFIAALKLGMYQKALQLEKNESFEKAANTFLAFQGEFPKDKNADRSLFNAAINLYKVAKVYEAVKAQEKLIQSYKKSKLVLDAMADIAQTKEALAEFEVAAKYYRDFAYWYPKDKRSSNALYNAGTLYRGLGKIDEAVSVYEKFEKTYRKSPLLSEAVNHLAELFEIKKSYRNSVAYYQRVSSMNKKNMDQQYFAKAKIAEITYMHLNRSKGLDEANRLAQDLKNKNSPYSYEARRIIARILFNEIEPKFSKFAKKSISNAKKIETLVKNKQKMLENLAAGYENVIAIGSGEYIVASLYRLGEIHEKFAKELFDAPAPVGANQMEINAYRSSIDTVAFPLKEEATKYFEAAYLKSTQVQTFTDWTRRAYQKIAKLKPNQNPKVLEKSSDARYMAHSMVWQAEISNLGE